jgi:hypothetical protein
MKTLSALILILALTLTVLPSCKYLKNNVFGKKGRELAELRARQDSIRVADSISKAEEQRAVALENARLDSIRIAEEERIANQTRYNIIVGGFVTPEYAKIMADEYTKMGYDVRLLQPEGSKFELVALEGHKTWGAAARRLEQFRDTVQLDSWIYIIP